MKARGLTMRRLTLFVTVVLAVVVFGACAGPTPGQAPPTSPTPTPAPTFAAQVSWLTANHSEFWFNADTGFEGQILSVAASSGGPPIPTLNYSFTPGTPISTVYSGEHHTILIATS